MLEEEGLKDHTRGRWRGPEAGERVRGLGLHYEHQRSRIWCFAETYQCRGIERRDVVVLRLLAGAWAIASWGACQGWAPRLVPMVALWAAAMGLAASRGEPTSDANELYYYLHAITLFH